MENPSHTRNAVHRGWNLVLAGILALGSLTAQAQTNEWSWMSGSSSTNQTGTYGTQGTAAVTNMPGARTNSVTWKDASGNLWLFGGYGYGASSILGYLNDLWKYNTATGQWTWMSGGSTINQFGSFGTQGVEASTNMPSTRYRGVSWTDASGNFWLFGGSGYSSTGSIGTLNDLWKYNTATGQWTWMSGSSSTNQTGTYGTKGIAASTNMPGGHFYSVSWTDASGNLWLFGGSGFAVSSNSGFLNDLWKYNTTTGQWTWMGGSSSTNQFGTYGTQGTAASTNKPSARDRSSQWTDASGNVWLFGGYGYAATTVTGSLNDLWKYNMATNEWTWMSGASTINPFASYGTQGIAAATNVPGAHLGSIPWTDASGNLWLFAGQGYTASSGGNLNDLWNYDISTGLWTWMGGSSSTNQTGTYGTQGTAASTNIPGGRNAGMSWTDASGDFRLFGGFGFGASGSAGRLNDMWKYTLATPIPTSPLDSATVRSADCGVTVSPVGSIQGIRADTLPGADRYRYTFTPTSGLGTATKVYTSMPGSAHFVQLSMLDWGTTYSVTVEAGDAMGFGTPGAACTVMTIAQPTAASVPTTQLRAGDCGYMMLSPAGTGPRDYVRADKIAGASDYVFEVTHGTTTYMVQRPLAVLPMSAMPFGVNYSDTMTIRVAAVKGGVQGNFGAACTVATRMDPNPPAPRLVGTASTLSLYPNPASTQGATLVGAASYTLSDLSGRVVEARQSVAGNATIGTNLPAGMYLVQATTAGGERMSLRLVGGR